LINHIDESDWLNKEAISLAKSKWSEFFKPVTKLKHWDIPEFISIDGDDNLKNINTKLYDKVFRNRRLC
jgi:predicted AAA+ superfamily ATPase